DSAGRRRGRTAQGRAARQVPGQSADGEPARDADGQAWLAARPDRQQHRQAGAPGTDRGLGRIYPVAFSLFIDCPCIGSTWTQCRGPLRGSAMTLLGSPAEIFVIAHRVHPLHAAADRQGDPREPFIRRGTMPMRDIGREEDRLSWSEVPDRLTLDLDPAMSLLDHQDEASVMDVPVRSSASSVPEAYAAHIRR